MENRVRLNWKEIFNVKEIIINYKDKFYKDKMEALDEEECAVLKKIIQPEITIFYKDWNKYECVKWDIIEHEPIFSKKEIKYYKIWRLLKNKDDKKALKLWEKNKEAFELLFWWFWQYYI
jgi:hypothetical protein